MKLFIAMGVLYCLLVCAAIVWTAKADEPIKPQREVNCSCGVADCESSKGAWL